MLEIFFPLDKLIFAGPTWATVTITFGSRLRFYRDTALWPGQYFKATTEMYLQEDIKAEIKSDKLFCAQQKLTRAGEANLEIQGISFDSERNIQVEEEHGTIVYLADY